jgi:hypothetical protein
LAIIIHLILLNGISIGFSGKVLLISEFSITFEYLVSQKVVNTGDKMTTSRTLFSNCRTLKFTKRKLELGGFASSGGVVGKGSGGRSPRRGWVVELGGFEPPTF